MVEEIEKCDFTPEKISEFINEKWTKENPRYLMIGFVINENSPIKNKFGNAIIQSDIAEDLRCHFLHTDPRFYSDPNKDVELADAISGKPYSKYLLRKSFDLKEVNYNFESFKEKINKEIKDFQDNLNK